MKIEAQVVQLHWQNPVNPGETLLIAQDEISGNDPVVAYEEFWNRTQDTLHRHISERPDGWLPMVCTQDSEHFVSMVDGKLAMTCDQVAAALNQAM